MEVKATIVEVLQDNYQGGSGLPIKRDLFVEIPDDTKVIDIEEAVLKSVINHSLNNMWGGIDNSNYLRLTKVEILPRV